PVVFGWQVAATVVNRAWTGTVRGDDPHHAQRGHHQQDEHFHIHARNGGGDGQHRRQQRRGVRGGAGEQVVQQVERQQQYDGGDTRRDTAHQQAAFFTQPADKAGGGEAIRQRHQGSEPDEGVPRGFVAGDIVPLQHAGPQHQANDQQGSHGRFNPRRGEDPHQQRTAHEHQQQDLIARQFAQFFQFTGRPQRYFVVYLHFRRVEPVSQQRHGQDQQDAQRHGR